MAQKNFLKKIKERLEKEKGSIEKELKKFAKEDTKPSGDWDTKFPKFNGGEAGSAALEKAADEVEEYSTLLPIEHTLELRLKNINLALEKIRTSLSARTLKIRTSLSARTLDASHGPKKGEYGICEKCGKKIPAERLKASPEARFCLKCEK